MEVNGITINYPVIKLDIQPCEIVSYLEWLQGSLDPLEVAPEEFRYAQITISLLIESESLELEKSKVQSIFRKGTLFCNEFYYDFVQQDASMKRITDNACEFTVVLQSKYKYQSETILTLAKTLSQKVTIKSNIDTPVIYEIIPATSIIDFVINGIKIHNLAINQKLVIDGEKCIVTLDGVNKFKDTELEDFPSLHPGENMITVNNSNCTIKIRYKPRYV